MNSMTEKETQKKWKRVETVVPDEADHVAVVGVSVDFVISAESFGALDLPILTGGEAH